jgi:hypothetical protein
MAKPKRARSQRREADGEVRKFREGAKKLYEAEPGGAPDRPVTVSAASQVEPDAESVRCPFCRAGVRLLGHDAIVHEGRRLRKVALECRACHAGWTRFYTLALLN